MLSALPVAPRFQLLDIDVDALTSIDLQQITRHAIQNQRRTLIGNHNLHSLHLFHQKAQMRAFYSAADHIHVDGISIIWLARLLGLPLKTMHRTGYMDWLPQMMTEARQRGWRVFYLGSRPGVLEAGLSTLRSRFPGLQIDGRHGYFDKSISSQDNHEVLTEINEYQPDLLMVGMGMPIQEQWIIENLDALPQATIVACGALLDYVAGAIPTPPRWLGHLGLEWLYRLLAEPRRLSRRYLVEPWSVLALLKRHFDTRHSNPALKEAA